MTKKQLVIVESPAKEKTINKILGPGYVVKASYGHVMGLPKSKMGLDDDFVPTYVPLEERGKKAVIENLKKIASTAENVYLCSDPDREGEFIAFSLISLLGLKPANYWRVTFNEITPKAIHEAFANPRKIDMNLVNSQQARRFLDRIVGYKLSPMLWKKVLRGLSAGRVQSVATRLVAERERDISAFAPKEYWTISGKFNVGSARFEGELRLLDGQKVASSADDVEKGSAAVLAGSTTAHNVATLFSGKNGVIESYEGKETRENAYPPFSTSQLQQSAANSLGFDTKRTMRLAQDLYEGVKVGASQIGLITYMRTDSFSVSKDAASAAMDFVKSKFGPEFYPDKPNYYKSRKGSQEAHECIRPTNVSLSPDEARPYLQPDQHKLYDLIWKRFVASQMAPAVYDVTTCDVAVQSGGRDAVFRANGRVMKFEGWRKVARREDDKPLPKMSAGDEATLAEATPSQHFTQPPPRFNEASLVKILESEGVGRPSTYASILEVIQARGYVKKAGTGGGRAPLHATELGMTVTDSLVGHFPSIMDIGFTRDMEGMLDDVEDGKKDYKRVLKDFSKSFGAELKAADKAMPEKKGKPTTEKCRKCGGSMVRLLGRFGSFLKCEDESCKATLNIAADGTVEEAKPPAPTGIKCDKCGQDVVLASGRFGEYLCCRDYKDGKKCDFTMRLTKARQPARKVKPHETEVACEKCGKKMVIRVASRGKAKVGKPFMSCSGFPRCRATMEVPDALGEPAEVMVATWKAAREKDAKDAVALKEFFEAASTPKEDENPHEKD